MEITAYWDTLLRNNLSPCFVADKDKHQLQYINPKFKEIFQVGEEIIGTCISDFFSTKDIPLQTSLTDFIPKTEESIAVYHLKDSQMFQMSMTMFPNGSSYFAELNATDQRHGTANNFETAMSRCMEIYTQHSQSIPYDLTKYLCEFYDCAVAYIYRFDPQSQLLHCVAQWSEDPSLQVQNETPTSFHGENIMDVLSTCAGNGFFVADSTETGFHFDSTVGQVMKDIHVTNMAICAVVDSNHDIIGLVGINNRHNTSLPLERRLLTAVSRFVSQDVAKGIVNQTLYDLHHRDPLTGLYNRNGYARRIDAIMTEKPKTMGCISANVNGLKFINENTGISGGDEHIINSVKRLREHFSFDIFRMSGDEFIGFCPDVTEEDFEAQVKALHEQMKVEDNFDFSLGHSWYKGNIELNRLQMEADTVMYINKQNYYATSKREFDSIKDTTLGDLLSYLKNEEFMIYLQPQVKLANGALHGAEALIRRFDKENKKMVFPDQFIPLYEKKSVIRHVDMFVVEQVCKLLQKWQREDKAIPISVNLSRVTLLEFGIVEAIAEICDKYQVQRKFLVIEVTERVGLIENNVASSLILDFIHHGFKISLDDFGCAYSNIVTLAQIDVDEVKLDKSLVDNLTISVKNRVLVRNVINMCHELESTSTLAEGIEDKEQSDMLHLLGCELGQGYYYSRPVPVPEFVEKYMS